MKRKKECSHESDYSRHTYRYTKISQIPASTLMTIRKAMSGRWVYKSDHSNDLSMARIAKMYPDISPRCMQDIKKAYESEIVVGYGT